MRVIIQRNTLQDIQDCIISLNSGVSMFSNVNAKKPIVPCMAAFVSSSPSETNSCVPPAVPDTAELAQYLSYVGFNFLVLVSFILLCITVCICLKNTGIIATVMCLFTLGGAVIYTVSMKKEKLPILYLIRPVINT